MTRSFAKTLAHVEERFPDQRIIARLRRAGINSAPTLAAAVEHSRGEVAGFYVWLLGKVGGARAEASLLKVLRGRRRSLWMQAAVSLSAVGGPRVVFRLTQMVVRDREAIRREASAYALGYIDPGARRRS